MTGCYATRCPDEVAALPNVVRVVRNDEEATRRSLEDDGRERFGDGDGPCGAAIEPGVAGRTAFTLRVQTGCEERCSYCIIPTTRGAGRSMPIADVVREVERVGGAGFKEIALTGVHLGSYGRDLAPAASLVDLLRALDGCRDDVTFRISSLEPMDCTPEIVDLVAASGGRFAPHFHLPLQHASDRMLARDARPYTLDDYRRLVDAHRRHACRTPRSARHDRRIPGRDRRRLRRERSTTCRRRRCRTSTSFRIPIVRAPRRRRCADKVDGAIIRERGARLRAIGAELSARFRAVAGRHGSSRADARGRHAGGDRQLSEGEDSAGLDAQRARAGELVTERRCRRGELRTC